MRDFLRLGVWEGWEREATTPTITNYIGIEWTVPSGTALRVSLEPHGWALSFRSNHKKHCVLSALIKAGERVREVLAATNDRAGFAEVLRAKQSHGSAWKTVRNTLRV